MGSPETQAIVNVACDQVQCVILDQMIQDEGKKLIQNREHYQTLQDQKLRIYVKTLKKPTVDQLQKELAELNAKYGELCTQVENNQSNRTQ